MQERFKTVELIVEELSCVPAFKFKPGAIVGLRIELNEVALQRRAKQAGGVWNRSRQLWCLRYAQAVELGLEERIESDERSISRSLTKFEK